MRRRVPCSSPFDRLTTGTHGRRKPTSSWAVGADAVRGHAHHQHVGRRTPPPRATTVACRLGVRSKPGEVVGVAMLVAHLRRRRRRRRAHSVVGTFLAQRWATVVPHEPASDHGDLHRHGAGGYDHRRPVRLRRWLVDDDGGRARAGEGVRHAKQRLADVLDPAARAALARAMADHRPRTRRRPLPPPWCATTTRCERGPRRRARRRSGRPGSGLNGAVAGRRGPPGRAGRGARDRRPRRPARSPPSSPGWPTPTASPSCPTATATAPTWRACRAAPGSRSRTAPAASPPTGPRPPASARACVWCPIDGWAGTSTCPPTSRLPADLGSASPTSRWRCRVPEPAHPRGRAGHRRPPRRRRVRRRAPRWPSGRPPAPSSTT